MNLQFMLEQICRFIHKILLVEGPWIVSVADDPFVECTVIKEIVEKMMNVIYFKII